MSTAACEPSAVYPISINFAEAASIGCSRMKEDGENPSERVMVPLRARC
jgi:hypothetical protein